MRLISHVARRRDEGSEGEDSGPYLCAVRAIVGSSPANGQLRGALRFPRSHALADIEATMTSPSNGKITAIGTGTFVAVKPDHPAYHRW